MHDSTEELVAALDVGLTAKKVDNPKVDELLASGEVLLASVKNDPWMYEGAKGTHVILVAGQENDSYKIFDPNSNTPGPQLVPKEKFAAAFNHYGTAIKY